MQNKTLKGLFKSHKVSALFGRYITLKDIQPLIDNLSDLFKVTVIGHSVLGAPIHSVTIGQGKRRILMWSQMHGNESTTTKALFDLFNLLNADIEIAKNILNNCELVIIPMLNPDGAAAYTRVNANAVDLNRDAQDLSQPESKVLRDVFDRFKPHFCFNLHGQRTIFSAGKTSNVATVSFLTPAAEFTRSVTTSRTISMEVIAEMNAMLQNELPNQVGIYDDGFNANCIGDTFQSLEIPTILFEAGHYNDDYDREEVRRYIFQSYLIALNYIALNEVNGKKHEKYFLIPQNDKLFYDIIIRNAIIESKCVDVAIQFEEKLIKNQIHFIPVVKRIESLQEFYGHREIDAKEASVLNSNRNTLTIGNIVNYVISNNNEIFIKKV